MRRERSPEVLAAHWQAEAERQSLLTAKAEAAALQWQKLCAAAILDAACEGADRAIQEGRTYLAAHGWPESSQRDSGAS